MSRGAAGCRAAHNVQPAPNRDWLLAARQPVQDSNSIVLGQVHLADQLEIEVVLIRFDHGREWLGRIDGADRDPRFDARGNGDFGAVKGLGRPYGVEMLEDRPMVRD